MKAGDVVLASSTEHETNLTRNDELSHGASDMLRMSITLDEALDGIQ